VSDGEVAFPIWTLHATDREGGRSWTAVVQSDARPDGDVVTVGEDTADGLTAGGRVAARAHLTDGRVARLDLLPYRPELPPLWFVEVPEPGRAVPSTSLVAFTGGDVAIGTLLDVAAAQAARARSDEQVGAVRWYPHSGHLEQVYVAPTWRARRVGTALLSAVAGLQAARDLPRPWGSGQRTAEGERMRAAGRWAHLADELTHLLPPMTPADRRGEAPPRR
jgi:GNAT superfamily N-acetyltransferase